MGALIPVGRQTPGIVAFFDEMRLFGFAEGQNLAVLPNGFGVRNDELAGRAEALVKAAPDVIISGPDNYTRVLQQATRTIPLVAMTEDMVDGRDWSPRSPDRAATPPGSVCFRPNSTASGRKS